MTRSKLRTDFRAAVGVRLAVWPFRRPCATIPGVTSVLIVDDHPSFRASARALLQAEGFEVVGEAADGAEALRAVEELHPDVVLLDVQLPDIDGFEVAKRLCELGSPPKVILTSSRDGVDYGSCAKTFGAPRFVPQAEPSGARP